MGRLAPNFPVSGSAVQLDRGLGDGMNLQYFGETIVEHAAAMEAHIDVMRGQAAGDPALLSAIEALGQDVQAMKRDGANAVSAGKALEGRARTIAASIGARLD